MIDVVALGELLIDFASLSAGAGDIFGGIPSIPDKQRILSFLKEA